MRTDGERSHTYMQVCWYLTLLRMCLLSLRVMSSDMYPQVQLLIPYMAPCVQCMHASWLHPCACMQVGGMP